MQELRQSTEMKIRVGSAVDATDGVTPETGLTLGAADQAELLKHNGAAVVDISGATFAAITGADGWYDLTLTTAYTDTLGQLTIVIQDSSLMAPIFKDFMVVTANYWDSKYSTDVRQVDVTQWLGTAVATPTAGGVPEVDIARIAGVAGAANNLEDLVDFGYDSGTSEIEGVKAVNTLTTYTGNVPQTGDNYARLGLPDGVSISADISSVAGDVDTLLYSRLTASRATYLDNLSGGAVALASVIGVAGAGLTALGDTRIGNLDTTISSRLAPAGTLATVTDLTNAPTSGDLTATMKTSVNDEAKDVLTIDTIADSYAADGNQPTIAQAILAVQQHLQEMSISGTTMTIKKPDGSTTAMTFTLDNATTPTSISRST